MAKTLISLRATDEIKKLEHRKMIKGKGVATVMTIMLISVCGWIAVVGLVIKPPFWLGAILSWIGGIAIGLAIAYLMKRWWFKGMGGKQPFDTWKCHICGEERPDDKISVLTKPLVINGQVCGEQNIRYCNDRPACIQGAKEFSFFKEK